jgi:prepilin-type N-terminal cleavage/methylation domain-containing protein
MLLSRLQSRLQREEGFTLIELLVVLVIIAVLLAIAVPSYLGFKDRAERRAAGSNVRAALPSAEAYYSDQSPNSYTNMTIGALTSIDQGLRLKTVKVYNSGKEFCVHDKQGSHDQHFLGTTAGRAIGVTSGVCP